MSIYTIYKATCIITNKVYIGFDSNYPNRISVHKSSAIGNYYKHKFHNAIRKYGWNNFVWSIMYQSKDKDHTLNVMENYFITECNSYKSGYNSTLGGEGHFNKHTQETKDLLSSIRKSRPDLIESSKQNLPKDHKGINNPMYGKFGSNGTTRSQDFKEARSGDMNPCFGKVSVINIITKEYLLIDKDEYVKYKNIKYAHPSSNLAKSLK